MMGYSIPDLYHQPDTFGLEQIEVLDDGGSYDFELVVLWKHHDTGKLYWAQDSGCSCLSPFQDFTKLDDAWELTDETWKQFQDAVDRSDYNRWQPVDRTEMLAKAAAELRTLNNKPDEGEAE